jgi:hypothetical protein
MRETAHWFEAILIIAGALVLLVVGFLLGRVSRRFRESRFLFLCPKHDEVVEATLVKDTKTGKWTGVTRCTAFQNPDEVHCSKDCVLLLNRGVALQEVKEPLAPPQGTELPRPQG